jgi:hypothetical protein
MKRLGRIAVVVVASLGLALIGSAVQGMLALDGQLAAATDRDRQERTIEVKQQQRPVCPNPAIRSDVAPPSAGQSAYTRAL